MSDKTIWPDICVDDGGSVCVVNGDDIPAVMMVKDPDGQKVIIPPLSSIRGVKMWAGDAHLPAETARRLARMILASLGEVDGIPQGDA